MSNLGSSNRQIYDNCNYEQRLYESTSPLAYRLYFGYGESCQKCLADRFWVKYDPKIVDTESELLNLTRPLSDCSQFKYSPACKKSGLCMSTFDKSAPIVLAPEVCPIVYNNIPKMTDPGYRVPSGHICKF
jgi:hypothetical protein